MSFRETPLTLPEKGRVHSCGYFLRMLRRLPNSCQNYIPEAKVVIESQIRLGFCFEMWKGPA